MAAGERRYSEAERRYSVPAHPAQRAVHSEDLHAWSIYRQNLNSDFTDSALGSTDKSPLPYGNFQLRDTTVQSILAHPRYGPKSALGSNMFTYLKFGLPRVFPPHHDGSPRSATPRHMHRAQRYSRGARETSSGYDSSDNETRHPSKYSRKYRSDPDFRLQDLAPSYQVGSMGASVPLAALAASGARPAWASEADLLSRARAHHSEADRHSSYGVAATRPPSSRASRRSIPAPPIDYPDAPLSQLPHNYPNYYVNNLEVASSENKSLLSVSGLSFEVKAGEILGVLATTDSEATDLLDVLAGIKKRLAGDIIVNGQAVSASTLRRIVAHVGDDKDLWPDLTVEQTLRLHAQLRPPNASVTPFKFDSEDRLELLLEQLGLEQVRGAAVRRLTRAERRRLCAAAALLADPALLLMDAPTKHLDVFDTFFLLEFLRSWVSAGKLVILSLHPPTYEIFSMLSKVVLMSAGRTMFSGHRRDMLPYFASIDYPCPAYKNPSDYYLDLVTLDELSAAAMLESSGRIEQLAGVFRGARAPPPPPPAPAPLPAPPLTPNLFKMALLLIKRCAVYGQPGAAVRLGARVAAAALLSLITGAIFWDLPATDPQLTQNDRTGFHYACACVALWPLLLAGAGAGRSRRCAERDLAARLYPRALYFIVDIVTDLITAAIVFLAYLIPSYAMSGLYLQSDQQNPFLFYLGTMLPYLLSLWLCARAAATALPARGAALLVALPLLLVFVSAGYTLHKADAPVYTRWLEAASPAHWTLRQLLATELSDEAIRSGFDSTRCKNKQIHHQDIIVQLPCKPPEGASALAWLGWPAKAQGAWSMQWGVVVGAWGVAGLLLTSLAFLGDCGRFRRRQQRKYVKGYKTTPNIP